jgi:hypothetical protein
MATPVLFNTGVMKTTRVVETTEVINTTRVIIISSVQDLLNPYSTWIVVERKD